MSELLIEFVSYVKEILGIEALPERWEGETTLPLFLREQYDFFQVRGMAGMRDVVLCVDKGVQTPATIEKNLKHLAVRTQLMPVYFRKTITSYDRKRLIEKKIPFVVPGNQMYLPFCGIDLREWFIGNPEKSKFFGPATQYLLLYLLQCAEPMESNQVDAVNRLGYTNMTMVRAFREIEIVGIGRTEKLGKEKYLKLIGRRQDIWREALAYLKTPVQQKIYVRGVDVPHSVDSKFAVAGESALAKVSMLNEPRVPVWAIQSRAWINDLSLQQKFEILPYPEVGAIELELWRYPVCMPGKDEIADKLSLYLSLKDQQDERMQAALVKLLEVALW